MFKDSHNLKEFNFYVSTGVLKNSSFIKSLLEN